MPYPTASYFSIRYHRFSEAQQIAAAQEDNDLMLQRLREKYADKGQPAKSEQDR